MHELTKIAKRIGYTDKVDSHGYTEFYGPLLEPRRGSVKNVLEIGISGGGSIALWHEFFPKAQIYGIDTKDKIAVDLQRIKEEDRITLIFADAYNENTVKKFNGTKFDVLLDDGDHSLVGWTFFMKYYLPLLAKNGIALIEDIWSMEYCKEIVERFEGDKDRLSIIDRRDTPSAFNKLCYLQFKDGSKSTEQVNNEIIMVYM